MKIEDLYKHLHTPVVEANDDYSKDGSEHDEDTDDLDFDSILDRYMDEEKLHRTEGRAGVTNLATICRAIGYKDPNYYGQLSQKASIGDLILFLEDNSGVIENIIEFIKQHGEHNDEWKENLKDSF